jgi:TRAP transporter TAXI family solute receptor
MGTVQPTGFFDELRQRRRDLYRTIGPGALVTLIAFGVAFYFVEPPPPDTLVIATGSRDGRYHAIAEAFSDVFSDNGVTLEIRPSEGSVENFKLLAEDNGIDLAIVQGGTTPDDADTTLSLESLATLYFEPLWVFHRDGLEIVDLADLEGHRIAVGKVGSGSYALTMQLLELNGVADQQANTSFLSYSTSQAAEALENGDVDAAMFVVGAESPLVRRLLERPELVLMDFKRQQAYARRFPFLKSVVLEEGVVDFEDNLPASPVRLVAPGAMLVATENLHEAFVPLLMKAALSQHHQSGVFADDADLPTLDYAAFPVNATARDYFQHGPTLFQRYLSFWIASLFDRTKIMIIPLLTLMLPLFKVAPPIYRWRIRSRIYRWYGVLRRIDQHLWEHQTENIEQHAATLEAMSRELDDVEVPLSYMEEFYNLRLHIDLVRGELQRLQVVLKPGTAAEAEQ